NCHKFGIADEDFEFIELPSSCPVDRRPVIHVKTVQMRQTMTSGQLSEAVRRVDQITRARQDRNNIIHTVSFARATDLKLRSEFGERMLTNTSRNTQETVEKFQGRKDSPPWALVGPSFDTGWDFPFTECEYQIIFKVHFGDRRNPLVAARI